MIQIDMPMPKNCADCCFATADLVNGTIALFCMTPAGRNMYAPDLIHRKDRPEWCPLKEQDAVVHCKGCLHWDDHVEECGNPDSVCFRNGWTKPDWFCADGERKEGR